MSSTLKPRLPEILITRTLEKPSPTKSQSARSNWSGGLYKTKPAYIAKKITTEQLFGESCKVTSAVLSQINEEKLNEFDEPKEPSVAGSVGEDNEESKIFEPKNIFQKESVFSSRFKEQGKGPAYSSSGQIVKHSIVGSSDMFERHQRNLKRGPIKESGLFSDKENASFSERSGSKVLKPAPTQQVNDQSQMSLSALNTQTYTQTNPAKKYNATPERKKEIKKTIRVSKEDLFMKIDQMRKTQDKFYDDEAKKYTSEPFSDQLFHSKEQRCLEKYNKSLVQWDNMLYNANRKIRRNVGKSVMTSSDGFREKVEEAQVFTLAQTEHERFGSTYWYMTLRNYGGDSAQGSQRVIQDIPSGFNSPQAYRPISSMEIVKKPLTISKSTSILPSLSSSILQLDRTKKEYIDEKSTLMKKELKKIIPVEPLMIDDFMIEGRNKLELEVNAFFKTNPSRDIYHVPREIFEDKVVNEENEYFARNYEGREVIKNGIGTYIK